MVDITIEELNDSLDFSAFSCKTEDVNFFLHKKGLVQQKKLLTTIYTLHINKKVIGYIAIACGFIRVQLKDEIDKMRIPGLFIGQLGIDAKYEGNNLGQLLIKHVIAIAHHINKQIACRIIFLESMDEKVESYKKKFFEFVERPRENRNIMIYDLYPLNQK